MEVARLELRFVPIDAHRSDHRGDHGLMEWLDYYTHDKVMFRFALREPR